MNGRKKKIAVIIAVFFIFLIICTWLSRMVYEQSLINVTVKEGVAGVLSRNYTRDAVFSYETKGYEYTAPVVGEITEVFIKEEDQIKIGAPLYKYDLKFLQLQVLQNQLALLNLEKQNQDILPSYKAKEDLEEEKRILYEMNEIKINGYEEQIKEYEDLIRQDGLVVAQHSGKITSLVGREYAAVQKGQFILQIKETGENARITWTLDTDKAQYFELGHQIRIPLQIWSDQVSSEELISKKQFFDLEITNKEYESNINNFLFTIDILENQEKTGDINLDMNDNTKIKVDLVYKSQEYGCIVPRSAVVFEGEFSGYVYCLKEKGQIIGLQQYAEAFSVEVLEIGDKYVAISEYLAGKDIIIKSERAIEDGKAVKVIK